MASVRKYVLQSVDTFLTIFHVPIEANFSSPYFIWPHLHTLRDPHSGDLGASISSVALPDPSRNVREPAAQHSIGDYSLTFGHHLDLVVGIHLRLVDQYISNISGHFLKLISNLYFQPCHYFLHVFAEINLLGQSVDYLLVCTSNLS